MPVSHVFSMLTKQDGQPSMQCKTSGVAVPIVSCAAHLNLLNCLCCYKTASPTALCVRLAFTGSRAGHTCLISQRAMAEGLTAGGVQRLRDGVEDEPFCLRVRAA